jgi:hypothetical protein
MQSRFLCLTTRWFTSPPPLRLRKGPLDTLAAAYWVLQPTQRKERITRSLRWHAKNMKDAENPVGRLSLPGHRALEDELLKLDAVAERHSIDTSMVRRRVHKHRDGQLRRAVRA